MRTTLTLDSDVMGGVERYQAANGLKFKEAVNRLLRAGLESAGRTPTAKPYNGPVFDPSLLPGLDPNRMNQLRDELELEDHLL